MEFTPKKAFKKPLELRGYRKRSTLPVGPLEHWDTKTNGIHMQVWCFTEATEAIASMHLVFALVPFEMFQ